MKTHRLATINYRIRGIAFAWSFVVVGLVLWERQAGVLAWALAALQFLVYPHLMYLRAVNSRASRAAELQNVLVDPVLLGAWMAALGFPLWVTYAAFSATVLNNAVMRGGPGAALAVAFFAVGALAWIVPMGLARQPETGTLVMTLCFFGSAIYACGVGLVVYAQNQRVREAREKLREGERRYRLITEHAGDLVAMVDRDGRWLYSSPSYARLFRAEDLAPGRDAFRNLHEDDQFRVRGAVQVVLRSGESCRLRMRLHTADGTVRRFEAMVHAVREDETDERGKIIGAVIAARDVTELSDREEQVELAAQAFERMAEAMMITNAAGRILTVNQSYARITGYAASEVVGRHESEFRGALQPPSFYDDLYAEVLRNGHWDGTTWCRRRDGTLYREWRSVSAVRDAADHITHHVILFRELGNHGADAEAARSA